MGDVLVLRALKLGDLLAATPALRGIAAHHRGQRIVLAAPSWLAPIVDMIGGIDEIVPADERLVPPTSLLGRSFDRTYNLHGNGVQSRDFLAAVDARQRFAHAVHGQRGPVWIDGMHERRRWVRMVRWAGVPADEGNLRLHVPRPVRPDPRLVVVHAGASQASRRWPPARFGHVASELAAHGYTIACTGSDAEAALAERVVRIADDHRVHNVAGDTDLADLVALVARSSLLISGDTGVAHIASGVGTPSVTLFGPVPASQWGPPHGSHTTLSDDAARLGDVRAPQPDPALLGVRTEQVLDAAIHLLDR